jgi:hypothetical protein
VLGRYVHRPVLVDRRQSVLNLTNCEDLIMRVEYILMTDSFVDVRGSARGGAVVGIPSVFFERDHLLKLLF